jgi:hypothetical protein
MLWKTRILWGTPPYMRSSEYDQRIATPRRNRNAMRNLTCSVRLGKLRDIRSTVEDLECCNGLAMARECWTVIQDEYVGEDWINTLYTVERPGMGRPARTTVHRGVEPKTTNSTRRRPI